MAQITCTLNEDGSTELVLEGTANVLHTLPYSNPKFYTPQDTLTAAFASCILTMINMLAVQKKEDLSKTVVKVEAVIDEKELAIGQFYVNIEFPFGIQESNKQEYLKLVQTCPVRRALRQDIKVSVGHN